MTDTRLNASAAVFAIASLTACGGGPGKAQAAAAQPAVTPAPSAAGAAAPTPVSTGTVTGTVAETMNAGGYTYVRLQTGKDDVWIAATEFEVKAGERLTAPLEMAMQNFHSKTLNRDFAVVYFVSQIGRDGQPLSAPAAPRAAPAMSSHQSAETPVESIAPAPGGMSIAEVWARRDALAGKPVVIRGKVVKVNIGIMDRNWLHLQDGSGSAADRTNDLTVTTAGEARVGDIVTAAGALAIKKDFGSGYSYDAILEKATLTAK